MPAIESTWTFGGPSEWVEGNGVRDDELVDLARGDPLEGGAVEQAVRRAGVHLGRTGLLQRRRSGHERPGRVDDVVDDHGHLALDVTDDGRDLRLVVRGSHLVENHEVAGDHLGELARDLGMTGVGRDDGDLLAQVQVPDVLREHRHGGHVVDRDLEEPLHLSGVQIHGQHPIGARPSAARSATSFAVIGSRGRDFLSWRT